MCGAKASLRVFTQKSTELMLNLCDSKNRLLYSTVKTKMRMK